MGVPCSSSKRRSSVTLKDDAQRLRCSILWAAACSSGGAQGGMQGGGGGGGGCTREGEGHARGCPCKMILLLFLPYFLFFVFFHRPARET